MPLPSITSLPSFVKRSRNALESARTEVPVETGERRVYEKCPACRHVVDAAELEAAQGVCPRCGNHARLGARRRVELTCDAGSFVEWDAGLAATDFLGFPGYAGKLAAARESSGEPDAVICGAARIEGMPCALFVMNAAFMMGSMGAVVGEKITRVFERAAAQGLPVVGFTVSGGARMQEGTTSLMQMAKVSAAVRRFSDAGGFYLAVLTDPTSGGVTASFAMEADVTLAEPGALVAFAGPRVIEQTIHRKLPAGFQRAEFQLEHGFVDAIVDRRHLRDEVGRLLALHAPDPAARAAWTGPQGTAIAGGSDQPAPGATRPADVQKTGATGSALASAGGVVAAVAGAASTLAASVAAGARDVAGTMSTRPTAAATRAGAVVADGSIDEAAVEVLDADSDAGSIPSYFSPADAAPFSDGGDEAVTQTPATQVPRTAEDISAWATEAEKGGGSAFDRVRDARSTTRPTAQALIAAVFDDFVELHGDHAFGDDAAVVAGIATLGGMPVTVIGTERGATFKERIERNFGSAHPEGYRKALRLMRQAEKFGRPVVCLIDTSGAYCGIEAEERGQGAAIADNLVAMAGLATPVVSVVVGEGGSGGALALGVADRVWMLRNAVYSVISPEGCASILYKDAAKAPEAAEALGLTAEKLAALGIVDAVIEEGDGTAASIGGSLRALLEPALAQLLALPRDALLQDRYRKYRAMGVATIA